MFNAIIKGIAKNTSILLFQQIVTWASTFLLMLFLPRYLGPEVFGRLYLAQSFRDMFILLVGYGGNYLVAKAVSRERENTSRIFADIVGVRLVFAVISLLGMIAVGVIFGYSDEVRILLLIFGIGMLWQAVQVTLYGCYMGHELMKYTSGGAIAERMFVSVVGVTAVLLGAKAIPMVGIIVTGTFLNLLVLVHFAPKILGKIPRPTRSGMRSQFQAGVPYFMFTVFGAIYYRIDTVMLSKLAPESVVGWYGASYRLFDVWNFFPGILTTTVYPVLSRLWSQGEGTHKRTMHKTLEIMLMVGIPISFGAIYFARDIIGLFYGLDKYTPSIIVLQVLSAGLVLLYIDMTLGTTLLSSDKQRQMSIISLVMIPVNIGLNYALIPHFQRTMGNGGIGSALATMVTEAAVMISMISLVPIRILAASGVMMGALWLIGLTGLHWLALIVISPLFYFPALFVLGVFEQEEKTYLRSLMTRQGFENMKHTLFHR
jgi:O-antigen/teichoic acid export membrane protein